MNDTTVRTSAADALTDWQEAVKEVEAAGRLHADKHTRATKKAFKAAQEKEARLLKEYHNARMIILAAQCSKQAQS